MQNHYFGPRSIVKLQGVHPELILVASRALLYSEVDFGIIDGLRDLATQKQLVRKGKSQTLKSKHLKGDAIDVMAYVGGKGTWEWEYYEQINEAFQQASEELNIPIEWGGDWDRFKDGVHFQRVTA